MNALIDRAALFFCRIGWAGLSPKVPGTVGSLAALLMAPWAFLIFPLQVQVLILIAVFVLGGIAGTRAERVLRCKDPSQVVIDELLGQWIALLPVSLLIFRPGMGGLELTLACWPWMLLGFVLFRAFDIFKPWPIKASENWLPGGFGIMLDDLIAGLFAGFLLYSAILRLYV